MSESDDRVRVLHVEDDPDFAELATTCLERERDRFVVETAGSASEGLARLAEASFDCIVSDYEMPESNGIEFLQSVREEHPDHPFILFTGKGSEEIASEAISAGVTDYLQKGGGTSQYAVLANRIENAVEQYRSRRALEASQQRLSLFVEESPMGVIEWTEDFEFVRINDAAEGILGYEESELAGESWETVVPEPDREAVAETIDDVLDDDEGGYRSVNENVREDGTVIVCEWHNRVVTDEDGAFVGIFSQFWDITEEYRRRQRRERQHDALVDLATHETVTTGVLDPALERITETAVDVLDVSRVNVWLFDDDETLRCVDHYDQSTASHERGMELDVSRYPAYLDALESSRAIAAADARADPRTAELREDYLDPHDVGALLDATIRSEGEIVGVICHEHVGGPRDWTDDEVQFAADLADVVHRALRNSERVEQREEIAFQRAILEAQQEAVLDGMLVLDEAGGTVSYNDRFVELWDLPEETLEGGGDDVLERVAERLDVPDEFREVVDHLADHPGAVFRDELELVDGRVVDGYSTPLGGTNGGSHGRLWTFRDITERNERERRLTALHDVAVDLETCESVSEICERTIEASREILAFDLSVIDIEEDGYLVKEVVSEDVPDSAATRMPVEQGLAGKTFRTGESYLIRDLDNYDDATPQGPYASGLSIPIGDHGVFQAVAEETEAFTETDLELAELLVSHAESALSRLERERQLERQNERHKEFAEIVSHDLRNPLNVAQGRVELAKADCDSEHLEDATRALSRSQDLIDELMSLAREGDRATERERIDLSETVEECWRTVETAGLALEVETTSVIRADRSQLRQLLGNLFRNAVDHAGDGVTVTVGDLPNGFYVEDDGVGVPEGDREQVFEAGYSSNDQGTGLGLRIVRQIAEGHDWDVRVTESEDGGARFEVTGVEFA